ncbi:MAG: hypothetical protein P8Y25_09265 [Chromatiaceae bacterium]
MEAPRNQVISIVEAIRRRFVRAIGGSYAVAAILPGLGVWIRNAGSGANTAPQGGVHFSLPALMLGTLLFNAGLGVSTKGIRDLLERPVLLLGEVAANLATPLAFILVLSVLMRSWHNADEVQEILVGLALVASVLCGLSSISPCSARPGDETPRRAPPRIVAAARIQGRKPTRQDRLLSPFAVDFATGIT